MPFLSDSYTDESCATVAAAGAVAAPDDGAGWLAAANALCACGLSVTVVLGTAGAALGVPGAGGVDAVEGVDDVDDVEGADVDRAGFAAVDASGGGGRFRVGVTMDIRAPCSFCASRV
jgi:hypothetical protein